MKKTGNQRYRKDIDGLRAIAVLLVVAYHLGVPLAQAGFIGVDVFFVISGFLISKHIIEEINQGKFSLKNFYLRRMRRILPALIVVLFFVTILAYFIILSNDLWHYCVSLLSALLAFSNIYFWKIIGAGYFYPDAKLYPLLHTWSLGVEEQFYILWPLLLFIMLKRFRSYGTLVCTIMFCIASFSLYSLLSVWHGPFVFYCPITRGFELLIGAILAMSWSQIHSSLQGLQPWQVNLFSVVGFCLILYSGCVLSKDDYPGSAILLPCFGTALLIYTGEKKAFINQWLSCRILIFIGLISYSLYLWHWPFIVFLYYLNISINFSIGIGVFAGSMLLATLTWYLIEQPFRFRIKFGFGKTVSFFILIPSLFVIGLMIFFKQYPNVGFNTISLKAYQMANDFYGPLKKGNCMDAAALKPSSEQVCSIGDLSLSQVDVLVVGDSHAMADAGMIGVWLKHAKLKGYLMTQSGTAFILGNISAWYWSKYQQPTMQRNNFIKSIIMKNRYKYVVMAGVWANYSNAYLLGTLRDTNEQSHYSILKGGLEQAVGTVVKAGSIPVIMLDTPPLLVGLKYCGTDRIFYHCENNEHTILELQKRTRELIFLLKKKYPEIILINPSSVICQRGQCKAFIDGTPLYFDGGHLNYFGSVLIGKIYLKRYGNPFYAIS